MDRALIGTLEELRKRGALKFRFDDDGIKREGFAIWFQGRVIAYENSCRHIPVTLDYGDGRFFTPDGDRLICQTHFAEYDPVTGVCLRGPCPGARLRPLNIEVHGSEVFFLKQIEPVE